MSGPHACSSCGGDTAYQRRVRCARCGDQVHKTCRDAERICYGCRWREARRNGEHVDRPTPELPNPWKENH